MQVSVMENVVLCRDDSKSFLWRQQVFVVETASSGLLRVHAFAMEKDGLMDGV